MLLGRAVLFLQSLINNSNHRLILKLLNFSEFINEARLSDHAGLRIEQRINDSMFISFPIDARKLIKEQGLGTSDIASKAVDLIRAEFMERLQSKLINFEFNEGHRAVILMEPVIKIGAKRFPIKMTVSSFDEARPEAVKSYSGEKLCAYVTNNVITTIKLLPDSYNEAEVAADFEEHLTRLGKQKGQVRAISTDSVYTIELTQDGEVQPLERATSSMMTNAVEKDYTLTPGRKIKYYSKLTDSLVEVEIVEVINKSTYKTDKLFKIKTRKEDGSEAMKTLKAGDSVHLPIGSDGGWVNAKVTDQLYTIDNRIPNPILRVVI